MTRIVLDADGGRHTISRHVYGHFSEHLGRCIYDGFWVGEESPIPNTRGIRDDLVEALRAIRIPNLRWPGGCFADEYHWMDSIGPRERRPRNINTHWGGVIETNHFGTHEFLDLCDQLGCDPYICGNVGSGSVREMQQWVEYLTSDGKDSMAELRRANGRREPWKVRFWGVGNENWGCGGNMRPEYYADLYRRYATYLRDFAGNRLYPIACGANGSDYRWTKVLMQRAPKLKALSLHYYTRPATGRPRTTATGFEEGDWFRLLQRALLMDDLITRHSTIMDRYDPDNRVALFVDEWGTWHEPKPGTNPRFLYQQSTMRDALVAALTLDIFNPPLRAGARRADRADRERAASDGADRGRPDAADAHLPRVRPLPGASGGHVAALGRAGRPRRDRGRIDSGRILTADTMQAHNTFDDPHAVRIAPFDDARYADCVLRAPLPAMSVVALEIR